MDDTDLAALYRFFTEVGIISQLAGTQVERHLPGKLTRTQFGILGHLSRRPDGETPRQIAAAFEVPKTSMTHMLAGLDRLGFITLDPNPDDARSKIARITPAGGACLQQAMAALAPYIAAALSGIKPGTVAKLMPGLVAIREALDSARD